MVDVKQQDRLDRTAEKVEKLENDLRIVVDTVETLNKGNTSSKADNIQRGVQDARKVLGLVSALRAVLSLFKRK